MKSTHKPYESNSEHLSDWLDFLHHRTLRVLAEEPDNPLHPGVVRGRFTRQYVDPAEPHQEREDEAWAKIQNRLKAHRKDPKAPALGLEVLRDEGLDDNELIILVAMTVTAISEPLSSYVLGSLCSGPLGMTPSELMQILGPDVSPWGLNDWLNWRRYFRKSGKLVGGGLITVEADANAEPGEFLTAWVSLTKRGFKAVTGMTP